jgi:hypothetical protein
VPRGKYLKIPRPKARTSAVGGGKRCSSCRTVYERPEEHFAKHRATWDGFQSVCNSCKRITHRNWVHGLKSGERDRMLAEQDGRCAICQEKCEKLVIDHCHQHGNIRGLLCRPCNALLGMCQDDEAILRRAIDYLRIHARRAGIALEG